MGFLPQRWATAALTARRTASATASGSRRRPRGKELDGFQHGIVDGLVQEAAITVVLRNTNKIERRILDQLAFVGNGNRHRNGPGKAQSPAIGDRARIGLHQQHAVLVDASRRHFVDNSDLRRELHQIAVATLNDVAHAAVTGQRRMLVQMQRLAMHRDKSLRLDPTNEFLQFGTARMPRNVHKVGAVGDDLDALLDKKIDNPVHCLLVAGNGAGGIDDQVAGRERHLGVLILGDT